jgi:glycosyltransferase involved in cell wall biosynthesis
MPELSVIIPVFNTSTDALQRCFDSVKAIQGISYEVILVDDGSEEPAASFCRDYAKTEPEFIYLRKENGGVSSARNMGLEAAQGTYITFVDADDMLLVQSITPELLANDQDLFLFDILLTENHRDSTWPAFSEACGPISRQTLFKQLIVDKSINGPVAKLYRRSLIDHAGLSFDPDMVIGEDWDFVSSFAGVAQSIYYVDQPCYRYFRDQGNSKSRTARFPDKIIANTVYMFEKKMRLVQEGGFLQEQQKQMLSDAAVIAIENLFNTAADLIILGKLKAERKKIIRTVCKDVAEKLAADAPRKTRIKAWIARYFWIGVYPLAYLREIYLKRKG